MNPKRFLTIGGTILLALGILGVTGLLGKISSMAFFHPPGWINWFHLFFGLFVLASSRARSDRYQAGLTLFGAIVLLAIGALGLAFGPYLAARVANPEFADPSDHLVHLGVGLLALWGYLGRKRPTA